MTRRARGWQVVGLLLLGLVLVGSFLYRLPDHSGISEANFDRIQVGMTLPEVESIMGGPPNYIKSGPMRVWYIPYHIPTNAEKDSPWISRLSAKTDTVMAFVVYFDRGPDGKPRTVSRKQVQVGALPDEVPSR